MNRVIGAGVCVLAAAAGCQAPPKLVEPFPEPSRASGAWVVLDDRRPEWEKAPFTGPVFSLYRFTRVSPNPWVRLQKATEAVVADLPEKPERVDVVVTSFRLVSKEAARVETPRDADGNVINGGAKAAVGKGVAAVLGAAGSDPARPKTAAATAAAGALVTRTTQPPPGKEVRCDEGDGPDAAFDNLGPGATCSLRGVVRLAYPGGRDRDIPFEVLTARANESGTAYWGEMLEEVTRLALLHFDRQVRHRAGLPVPE